MQYSTAQRFHLHNVDKSWKKCTENILMHVTQRTTPVGSSHPIGAMNQYIMLLIPQTRRPSDSSGSMFINQPEVNEA